MGGCESLRYFPRGNCFPRHVILCRQSLASLCHVIGATTVIPLKFDLITRRPAARQFYEDREPPPLRLDPRELFLFSFYGSQRQVKGTGGFYARRKNHAAIYTRGLVKAYLATSIRSSVCFSLVRFVRLHRGHLADAASNFVAVPVPRSMGLALEPRVSVGTNDSF